MEALKEKIKNCGQIKDGDVLKVDSFLNHQIDTELVDAMADEFINLFADKKFTKVLTIETSGIALAYPVAQKLNVPFVFAKKEQSVNIDGKLYSSKIISYTHFREYNVIISSKFLNENDHVLIIDDFLAKGSALRGLLGICQQANAKVDGIGIAIEKIYEKSGDELRDQNYDVKSLVKIKSLDSKNNKVIFCD